LRRLGFSIAPDGSLSGEEVPSGLKTCYLSTEEMLPCVGQAALGIEIRENDPLLEEICGKLNHSDTWSCVVAERAFLRAMGGGCQSPVAAHAHIEKGQFKLQVASFLQQEVRRAELSGEPRAAEAIGTKAAQQILGS